MNPLIARLPVYKLKITCQYPVVASSCDLSGFSHEFKPYLKKAISPKTHEELFSPYLFTCPTSRTKGKRYTDAILQKIWKAACKKCGENIRLYDGTKKSTASQLINEAGLTREELREAGDWARLESTEAYARTEIARRKALLEKKVVKLVQKRSKEKNRPENK
jgi:hypothetical protein